jgi:hypothetical protein
MTPRPCPATLLLAVLHAELALLRAKRLAPTP